jgi:phage/plasmid-like protein (TIGR03299 family)
VPGDLDYTSDGRAAMFSVRLTPWHREGAVLPHPPDTIEEALSLAGLDFNVELQSVLRRRGNTATTVPEYFATVRTDRDEHLGVVGRRYTPLQNRQAFEVLQPLLDSGVATLETAGALRGGRDVWVLVRFDIGDPVVREVFADEVVPYALLSNNHAGTRRVTLQETPIRVVCANTLGAAHRTAAEGRVFHVRHTVNVRSKTAEAAQVLWAALVERYRVIAEQYRALQRSYLSDEQFTSLVLDVVTPRPEQWRDRTASKQHKRAMERVSARRGRLQHLWFNGAGHQGDGSAWEAYNATAEALDHDGLWQSESSRATALFDGWLGSAKQRVLDGLFNHARKQLGQT